MATSRSADILAAALELFTRYGYEATTMADIGTAVGIRGPSLYRHVASKQTILDAIMTKTMLDLLAGHRAAIGTTDDVTEQLKRAVESHVRYHARHRMEAFVGNRELRSLEEPRRSHVIGLRAEYEQAFRSLIVTGVETGRFRLTSPRLASFAILDLGMGLSAWYREDGELTEDELVWQYTDFALRLVGTASPN